MTMTMTTAPVETETETEVVIPDAILANARELDDIRSAMKEMEKREKALRAAVLDFLDTAGVDAATNGVVAIFKSTHDREGIDRARMKALYPKVLADVKTTTEVTQVRVEVKV